MRGLLNPLLVRLSARPLVRPVRAPSALIRPFARPPVRLHSPWRPPVRPSPVRPSAHPLSARPPLLFPMSACPPVRLLSARPPQSARPPLVRPSACPPQSARPPPVLPVLLVRIIQKITYQSLLVLSFLPLLHHVRSPRLQFVALVGATVASG